MAKSGSTFDGYLHEVTARGQEVLRQAGWLDPQTGGPDLEPIRSVLGPQEVPLPEPARLALAESHWSAAAHEALGEQAAAQAWYRLGQYGWRGGRLFSSASDPPEFDDRDAVAYPQLLAAVCAGRAGEASRAGQLFAWAAENHQLAPADLEDFAATRQYQQIWERLPLRAYALACLEEWDAAMQAVVEAERWVVRDRRAKGGESYQAPLRILPAVAGLARYRLDPSAENRRQALVLLEPGSVASRSHPDHLLALFLLYYLRQSFSELADLTDGEIPSAEAARQGAEACVRVMDQIGVHLDGSVESLKVLDRRAPELYGNAGEDQRRTLLFLWGCYLGETARRALPGGVWHLDPQDPLDGRVTWDVGESEISLWAFQVMLKTVTGQAERTLWQAWWGIEELYRQMG